MAYPSENSLADGTVMAMGVNSLRKRWQSGSGVLYITKEVGGLALGIGVLHEIVSGEHFRNRNQVA
jgi:hypothetical protein